MSSPRVLLDSIYAQPSAQHNLAHYWCYISAEPYPVSAPQPLNPKGSTLPGQIISPRKLLVRPLAANALHIRAAPEGRPLRLKPSKRSLPYLTRIVRAAFYISLIVIPEPITVLLNFYRRISLPGKQKDNILRTPFQQSTLKDLVT